jgi:hypothetical protein
MELGLGALELLRPHADNKGPLRSMHASDLCDISHICLPTLNTEIFTIFFLSRLLAILMINVDLLPFLKSKNEAVCENTIP